MVKLYFFGRYVGSSSMPCVLSSPLFVLVCQFAFRFFSEKLNGFAWFSLARCWMIQRVFFTMLRMALGKSVEFLPLGQAAPQVFIPRFLPVTTPTVLNAAKAWASPCTAALRGLVISVGLFQVRRFRLGQLRGSWCFIWRGTTLYGLETCQFDEIMYMLNLYVW